MYKTQRERVNIIKKVVPISLPYEMVFQLLAVTLFGCVLFACNVSAMPDLDWTPIVSTTLGKVQGNVLVTRLNLAFYAFRGIRYGKAPVGDLRFKAPLPAEPWANVFNATHDGPMCMQFLYNNDYSQCSEDCLRLNVYTHNVSDTNDLIEMLINSSLLYRSQSSV